MSSEFVEKIKKYVEEECKKESNFFGAEVYKDHFTVVVKYAKMLAEKSGADMEIVEISAWLHDIASILGDYESHHISGAEQAETLLKKFNYPIEKIENVKHCIMAHRGSKDIPRKTIEAECICNADAMSHFDTMGSLFKLALVTRKFDSENARKFVKDKLERSWNKLTPQAKEVIRPKYEAAMLLLGDKNAN